MNKHLTDILEAPNGIPLLLSEQVLKEVKGLVPYLILELSGDF